MMNEKLKNFLLLVVTSLLSFIFGCNEETDIAKPRIKDYSQKAIAGFVTDTEGKILAHTRVYFTRVDTISHHTYISDSTETDDKGFYYFKKKSDHHHYRTLAKAIIGPDTLFGVHTHLDHVWDRPAPDTFSFDIEVGKPASMQIYLRYRYFDSFCLEGSFACISITDEDRKKGYVTLRNIPPGVYTRYNTWGKDSSYASPLFHYYLRLKTDSILYWSADVQGYAVDSIRIAIPPKALAILDSAKLSPILNNLIIPVIKKENYDALMDERGNAVNNLTVAHNDTNANRYWATIDSIGPDEQNMRWISAKFESHRARPKFKHNYANIKAGTDLFDTLYTQLDSSHAISFWVEKQGDSGRTLLTAGSDSSGFEIAQCKNEKQLICIKIYNKVDSSIIDTTIHINANVLDEKLHHVSFVIHKQHIFIAIDGETINETDMIYTKNFFKDIRHIHVGDIPLKDFLVYYFDASIRKSNDKDWTRLKAWLKSFYLLQATTTEH